MYVAFRCSVCKIFNLVLFYLLLTIYITLIAEHGVWSSTDTDEPISCSPKSKKKKLESQKKISSNKQEAKPKQKKNSK